MTRVLLLIKKILKTGERVKCEERLKNGERKD